MSSDDVCDQNINIEEKEDDYENQLSQAKKAHKLGNYDECRKLGKSLLDNGVPVRIQMMAYYWISWSYLSQGDFDKSLEIANQGLDIMGDEDYRREKAYLYNVKGVIHKESGRAQEALEITKVGYDLAKHTGDTRLFGILVNNLASVYFFMGKYNKSLRLFYEVLDHTKNTENRDLEATSLSNIGELYQYIGDPNLAKQYFKLALEKYQDLSNTPGVANTKRKLGEIHYATKNFGKARAYLQESIKLNEQIGNTFSQCFAYFSLGKLKLSLGEDIEEILLDLKIHAKESKNQILIQLPNLLQAIELKNSNSLLKKGQAMVHLEKVIEDDSLLFEIMWEASIHYLDLLIQEYILTEEKEKLKQIVDMVDTLYARADDENITIKILEALILKSKLNAISMDMTQSVENLNHAKRIAKESGLQEYTKEINTELQKRHQELQRYQKIIDANSSLIDKVQESGLLDYVSSIVKTYQDYK